MAKSRTNFVCRSCGGVQSKWMGKCPDCGAWDSLEEHRVEKDLTRDPQRGVVEGMKWAVEPGNASAGELANGGTVVAAAMPIAQIEGNGVGIAGRLSTGISELDRVLGGGLVPGSVVLVGGDPGIGKSTLMLQAAGRIGGAGGDESAKGVETATDGANVLYVSSEESAEQVKLRAERLEIAGSENLYVLADTNLARIVEQTRRVRPSVLVIDSVQMVYKADLDASPGSVAQLRRCCAELVYLAKLSGTAVIMVGHVTKDGQLAGPRLLEHLVDVVLYFEGDRHHAHRIIRGVKNRFGTTLEIGIFEMTDGGLREAPGGLGVGTLEAGSERRPGSVVCPVMTGARCMLVEIQALSATGFLGAAKRKASGIDANRLAMIIAVLEQHAGMRLADRDLFASSVGGIRVVEPAADLALLLAIAGSQLRRGLEPGTAAVGEVGLGGEVRSVGQIEQRVKEAGRLGFRRVIVPAGKKGKGVVKMDGVEVVGVRRIGEAVEEMG